ncbi:MAG: HdeD family acid-resistance protein [Steroidobacteraceae bacterium]
MAINQEDLKKIKAAVTTSLHEHWGLFLSEGIILVILGFIALVLPAMATFAVEIVIGWVVLLSGIVGLISTFRMRSGPGFWWSLFSAALGIAAGIVLLVWPLSGVFSLTLILTVFLLFEGVASIMLALHHRRSGSGHWGMLLASGIIDLALAAFIFLGLPGTAVWILGLVVGVNMLFGGSALISMAWHARSAAARGG